MTRDLSALESASFDLVIIGGGIYGLSTAWDAALRGLSVALLEKDDFAHATSAAHYKLVHGGLRYLQHLDFKRMRVSIRERRWMMRAAPHMVDPVEFLIPCYGHGMKGAELLMAAFFVNDLIGWDRNRGIARGRRIPRGHLISKSECLRRVPGFQAEGLTAGAVYADAQVYSSERFAMAIARSAEAAGARLFNYAEVTGAELEGNRMSALTVKDRLGDQVLRVRGGQFVNMTGPWSEITRELVRNPEAPRHVVRSKGVQFFTRPLAGCGFTVETRQKDKTAKVARGGRSLFVQHWRGKAFIGQSDRIYRGNPDDFRITEQDLLDFLEEFNQAYPHAGLKREDVCHWIGGMIPVGQDDPNGEAANVSHRYEILDHRNDGGPDNFISVIGVKFTICRYIAERVVDLVQRKRGGTFVPGTTSKQRVWGGELDDPGEEARRLREGGALPDAVAAHLVRMYGGRTGEVLRAAGDTPEAKQLIRGSDESIVAEVLHAVRAECAFTLRDVILRRTDLGTLGHPGPGAVEHVADLMAAELAWSDAGRQEQIDDLNAWYALPVA